MNKPTTTKVNKPEDIDFKPITFGKYSGKTPERIAEIDPAYVVWMYDKTEPKPCSLVLRNDCEKDVTGTSRYNDGGIDDTYDRFNKSR
jgi:hypothetical protein